MREKFAWRSSRSGKHNTLDSLIKTAGEGLSRNSLMMRVRSRSWMSYVFVFETTTDPNYENDISCQVASKYDVRTEGAGGQETPETFGQTIFMVYGQTSRGDRSENSQILVDAIDGSPLNADWKSYDCIRFLPLPN